jgi:DNA-binding YbaB/EbfC family protein
MDMEELMRQAQQAAETIQKQMSEVQVTLDSLEVEGSSGGGLVKIRATAKGRILGIEIDDSLLQPSEKAMLEDLIAAAFNDARSKGDAAANSEMQKMSSALPLPPGFKLPF